VTKEEIRRKAITNRSRSDQATTFSRSGFRAGMVWGELSFLRRDIALELRRKSNIPRRAEMKYGTSDERRGPDFPVQN